MKPDDITAQPEEAAAELIEPVPTLREQIETHLWFAHDAVSPDKRLMHLSIAAGIGLASVTIDDLDAEDETRGPSLVERLNAAVIRTDRSLK